MNTLFTIIGTTGLGVLTMYVFDPVTGRMRRAKARDQLTRFQRRATDAAGVTARDLRNRAVGTFAETRAKIFGGSVDDVVLTERVRSKLGFMVRHPSFIDVRVSEGRVTLSGRVLSDEVQQLMRGVAAVRGVRDVENRLEAHERAEEVPGFQADIPKPAGETIDLFQHHWAPSTRFLVGTAGAALALLANRRSRNLAPLSALVGLGCLFYGVSADGKKRNRKGEEGIESSSSAGWTA
jgi:hypothetical protein